MVFHMRKIAFLLKSMFYILTALFVIQIVPQIACASNLMTSSNPYTGTSYTIRVDGNNGTITKYSGSGWDFAIPATVRGFQNNTITITGIDKSAFKDATSLRTLTIPDTVTSIGEYAFYGCNNLITVNMPVRMTSIGKSAFGGCASLTSITIPNGISSINESLFYNCRSLSTVSLPAGITDIGTSAFWNCSSLINIDLPDSVVRIGPGAFRTCTALRSITIPRGVTIIYDQTFRECTSLTNVTLPEGITRIDDSAFSHCSSLSGITLPDSLRQTGMFVFSYCTSLKSIAIPANLTRLNDALFQGCKSLTSAAIPNSVTYIGEAVFEGCSSLKSIVIPDSAAMNGGMFRDCTSLESIKFSAKDISIGSYTFYNCTSLRSITIPERINYFGDHAFEGCRNLTAANFLGDAPYVNDFGIKVFDNCAADFKIRYLSGKTGWSNPFHDYPAERVFNFPDIDLPTATLPENINPNTLENIPNGTNTNSITLKAQAAVGLVKLNWNSITDAKGVSGYNVYKSTHAGNYSGNPEKMVTVISYIDSNVKSGTSYYYTVKPVFNDNSIGAASNEVSASPLGSPDTPGTTGTIQLSIDNPIMTRNGIQKDIDTGFGTAPVIKAGRTFLPIRALITEMGGDISWNSTENKIIIQLDGSNVELWIGKKNVRVDGIDKTMDVAPYISASGRTMLPLRFVGENLGCDVSWDDKAKSATIVYDHSNNGKTPNNQPTANTSVNQTNTTTTNTTSGSWSGTWDTDWGKLVLTQTGDKVTGTYDYYAGSSITGSISGNKLTGTFIEKKGTEEEASGLFEFIINDKGTEFEGRWGDSDTAKDDWFYWNGEKR